MADEGRARKSPNSKDSDLDSEPEPELELEGLESDEEDELDVNPPSFSSDDERKPKYQSDDDEDDDDDKHSQPLSSDEADPKSQSDSDSESDLVFLAFDKENRRRRPFTAATAAASSGDPMLTTVLELLEASTGKQQRRQMKETWEKREESRLEREREFDFPIDEEKWREEDLMEMWRDAPFLFTKPGWDPWNVDLADDYILADHEMALRQDPPSAPFYVPYQKYYPVIPSNHPDIKNAKQVVEELDRVEEFLNWVSYIFPDGSSYEGTVWDDLAHGKGVYVADHGLLRYEGEWFRNMTEGHGVLEYDIPYIEPVPGSKLEAKMRAQGKIIKRDFMSPEDREWLEMDIEDSFAQETYATPVHRLGGVKQSKYSTQRATFSFASRKT